MKNYSIYFGWFVAVDDVVAGAGAAVIVFVLATMMNDMRAEMVNWYVLLFRAIWINMSQK